MKCPVTEGTCPEGKRPHGSRQPTERRCGEWSGPAVDWARRPAHDRVKVMRKPCSKLEPTRVAESAGCLTARTCDLASILGGSSAPPGRVERSAVAGGPQSADGSSLIRSSRRCALLCESGGGDRGRLPDAYRKPVHRGPSRSPRFLEAPARSSGGAIKQGRANPETRRRHDASPTDRSRRVLEALIAPTANSSPARAVYGRIVFDAPGGLIRFQQFREDELAVSVELSITSSVLR